MDLIQIGRLGFPSSPSVTLPPASSPPCNAYAYPFEHRHGLEQHRDCMNSRAFYSFSLINLSQLLSRTGPITSPLSSTIQSDILGILQREQDHAISLLSLSPLLASLFISYANRAATLESASATPSSDSEEWKALHATITVLQEENEKLKSETQEMAGKLKTAEASHEAFRSQVSYLKEVNTSQQDDIKSLQAELVETNDWHDKLMADSSAERAALQIQVSDLEVRQNHI